MEKGVINKEKRFKIFKKILVYFGGITFSITLCMGLILVYLAYPFEGGYMVFIALAILILLGIIFWHRAKIFALGILTGLIVTVGVGCSCVNDVQYINHTRTVSIDSNHVSLYAAPDHDNAEFVHVDTNTKLVKVGGQCCHYYRKEGRIVAVHESFPDVLLFTEIKEDTYHIDFDFNKKKVRELRPSFFYNINLKIFELFGIGYY